ncbi:MAG: hypothetical protein HZA08_01395 [Nitrospirae bacterium]|nr:hypothetical protein [Nitrospirota bacterium]
MSTQRWPEDEMHKCIGYFMTDPKYRIKNLNLKWMSAESIGLLEIGTRVPAHITYRM